MIVELAGLELFAHHGVLPEEREHGQRFLVDLRLEPSSEDAAATDRIEDAVDYRDAVTIVRRVSDARAFHLLEALAAALADALLSGLPIVAVSVTVRKPDVVLDVPVEHAAVTVERRQAAATDSV